MTPRNSRRRFLCDFADIEMAKLQSARLARLQGLRLNEILKRRDPYLFGAFGAQRFFTLGELATYIVETAMWQFDEKLYDSLLRNLAVFVVMQRWNGKKSSAEGLDLEFDKEDARYLVAVKSGPNWGNRSQWKRLEDNFKRALAVQRQSRASLPAQAVLGSCYGRKRFIDRGFYQVMSGQRFWHFLSHDPALYVDIIEPIGHDAKRHNDDFHEKRAALETRFTVELAQDFCKPDYTIDWQRLVAFNSGNMQ